jgi:NitT/TauT family transport system substrate-binding protein
MHLMNPRLIRSTILVALTLFSGCQANREAAAPTGMISLRLQADWFPQPEQGGFFTALAKGIYKAEGLDVSILPLGQYTSALKVVASGGAEFGLASSDMILEAVANGLPLVAIGASMQHDPQAIMVHKSSPVRDFTALEGRSVAAHPSSTWFKFIVSKYQLKNVRETPATQSIANFLADPNYIQQIFVTSEPYFVKAAGVDYRTMLISDAGYDPYRVFFVHKDFLAKNPDTVRKFVRASIEGWRVYLRDPDPAHAMISKLNPAQNPDQMKFSLQAMRDGGFITGADPTGPGIGRMTPARWAATNEQLTSLGVIRKPIDPASAYTLQFLP